MKKASVIQQAYWDTKLALYGLTEDAGRKDWISYGHEVTQLDTDGRKTYKPTAGESLEHEEWPISLM